MPGDVRSENNMSTNIITQKGNIKVSLELNLFLHKYSKSHCYNTISAGTMSDSLISIPLPFLGVMDDNLIVN